MKTTKKALALSVLSLILCVTMLLGTTYAWFTDSVKSGVNQIIAGNLDVELYHQSKNVAKTKVTESTDNLFKDVTLWEPGAYAYETFTVANEGTLALKFKMALNVLAFTSYNGHNLTEVIKVATTDTAPATREAAAALSYTALKDWNLTDYSTDNALAPKAEKAFTVVLYWEPTANDNDYNMNNGRPSPLTIDLGVTLVATQQTAENDSFDDQYDKDPTNTLPEPTKYESKLKEASSPKTTVPAEGPTVLKAAATPTTSTVEDRQDTTVTFPEGTLEAGKDAVLNVKTTNTLFEVTAAGAKVASIDLKLTVDGKPVTNFDGEDVTVVTYISAGLTEVSVAYVGVGAAPTIIEYVPATGKLTFKTNHFSEFTASGKAIAYILGEKDTGFEGYEEAAISAKTENVELTKDADMQKAAEEAEKQGSSFVIPTQTVQDKEKTAGEGEKVQENFAARIGTKYYAKFETAVKAAQDGDVVVLFKDDTLSDKLVIENKKIEINLGGNTVTGRINVVGSHLTVKNGTLNAGSGKQALNAYGTIDSSYNTIDNMFTYIKVEKDVTLLGEYGMCFLPSVGAPYANTSSYGVVVDFYGTAKAGCGAFVSGNIGATSDGRNGQTMHNGTDCPVFNVYGKLLGVDENPEESTQGISVNGYAVVNIYDGAEVSGAEAVGFKAGRLNVFGGTLTATGPKCDPVEAINSGIEASGGAISVVSTYSAGTGTMYLNVKGGKIESKNNAALLITHTFDNEGKELFFKNGVVVNISGGEFIGNENAIFVDAKQATDSETYPTKFITGGTFSSDPSAYVAPDYSAQKSENAWIVVYDPYVFDHLEDIDEANGTVTVVKKSFKNPSTEPDIKLLNQPLYVVTKGETSGDYDTLVLSFKNEVVNGKKSLQSIFAKDSLPSGAVVLIKEGTYTLSEGIIDFYGDVIFTGEAGKAESTVLKVYESYMIASNKAYKIFRLQNRVKGAPVSNFAFANMTIQSYNDTDNNDNAFFATCYNIKCDIKNVTFKDYKGYCVGAWANDTYTDGTYPSKEDNLGVMYFMDNVAFDNCGTAFYFDTAPYTTTYLDRYGFIHFWYKNTEISDGMTMYRYASSCDDTAGNWMINGEIYNKSGIVIG